MIVSHGRRVALVLLASSALPGAAQAVTCTWSGKTAAYSAAANWSCGRIPTIADAAIINAGRASIALGEIARPGNVSIGEFGAMTLAGRLESTDLANDGIINITGTGGVLDKVLTVTGSGVISLDNAAAIAFATGETEIGAGQTIQGIGRLLAGTGAMYNRGSIRNTLATGTLTIDPRGGLSGITDRTGYGTNASVGFYNDGSVRADRGQIQFNGGLYQMSEIGSLETYNGAILMASDSRLLNINNGALVGGRYEVNGNGNGSNIRLRGDSAVDTLGDGTAATAVRLSGAGSSLTVLGGGTIPTLTSLDDTLIRIAAGATLELNDGRSFNRGATVFTNNGTVILRGGTFTAGRIVNGGEMAGSGTFDTVISGSGSIIAAGSLTTKAVVNDRGMGLVTVYDQSSLRLTSGNSIIGTLDLAGSLILDGGSVTIAYDYINANFGSGSAFNAMANVTTAGGTINAVSATQDLSGVGLSGAGFDLGATRLGTAASRTLTITNRGGLTTLRGAVQSAGAGDITLSISDFVLAPNFDKANLAIGFGSVAGRISDTIKIVNNFANVDDDQIAVTGRVYKAAAAGPITPSPISFTSRTGQAGSTSVFIGNIVTGDLVDTLVASVIGGGAVSAATLNIAAGKTGAWALNFSAPTAGLHNGTVNIGLTSHNDEMADLALAGRSLSYTAKVYATAAPTVDTSPIALGATRVGGTLSRSVTVGNANGGTYADTLKTTAGATGGATATAPGTIAAGGSGALFLSLGGGASGRYSGVVTLGFASHNDDMADLSLGNQTISYTGAIYTTAVASQIIPSPVSFITRTGQTASTNVFLRNVAGGALADRLLASVVGGTGVSGAAQSIAAGTSTSWALNYSAQTGGVYNGIVAIALASHNDEMADLALAGQNLSYTAKVYATAAPVVDTTRATFAVRQGSGAKTTSLDIRNGATGGLTDSLLTSVSAVSSGFTATAPASLAGGATGAAAVTLLDTSVAGVRTGSLTLGFKSHDNDLADLVLDSQTIVLTGIVTQLASARLVKLGGDGTLAGSGTSYSLDLGQFAAGGRDGLFSLGVLNDIVSASYGERLAGVFAFSGDNGFSFSGDNLLDIVGGAINGSGRLSFAAGGLGAGDYTGTLYVDLVSRYDGLTDLALDRIRVNVRATVLAAASVPEPATWLQMIFGLGMAGVALRRRRGTGSTGGAGLASL